MERHNIKITGVFWLITKFEKFFSSVNEYLNAKLTLNRIKAALNHTNFDEKKLGKIIHIAGTNGKGSTAHFISSALINSGYKVALFTSPHLLSICERIKVNRQQIRFSDLDNLFTTYFSIIKEYKLTYFEAITLLAFKYFEEFKPDFSIIETGMGGTYDATNVLENKIPVITSISIDHEQYLGKTLESITREKAAIVKENDPIFLGTNNETVYKIIASIYPHKKIITPEKETIELLKHHFPSPYYKNAALAKMILNYLNITAPFNKISLPPCRFEKYDNIIIDGAHNFNGIIEILKNFKQKPIIVFSSTKDRDYQKIINLLSIKSTKLILTEIPNNIRSIKLNELETTNKNIIKESDLKIALRKAVELSKNNDILVCGSLYLCAEVKKILKGF
ncbi:bifunctional folylpolyglutamate synthase/dihydrofolate synthase [Deferribacter autotrophicus]|uniref:bifunctional folylpolyglutamate synthase/dihydrofolate synthase n=1 Tax=Deferribacter autotrophicus TaxID=500465 RepID=UPI00165E7465|nr:Mur ligase family protein [Deferribacter autotrophicus]